MNELIFFLSILCAFGGVVLTARFLGKHGLVVWVAVATVLANLLLPKAIKLFGMDATLGNVMFASTYLCTDILVEVYGNGIAKKAVIMGFLSVIIYIIATQFALWYTPSDIDYVNDSMKNMFTITARISIASVCMYFLANLADVYLFGWLKQKFPNALWLRNNVSTIVCNCGENFLFALAGFWGLYSFGDCISLAVAGSLIEIVVSLCDTPFVYLGRSACRKYEELHAGKEE